MEVKVVLATNEKYVGPTAATVYSVLGNGSDRNKYHFYILHSDLTIGSQNKLTSIHFKNAEIECIDVSDYIEDIVSTQCRHLTKETLYRLFIPELFPDDDKILYMDVDMIALADVAELYSVNLNGYLIAACPDVATSMSEKHYGAFMPCKSAEYFNAGLLLINNKEFLKYGVKEKSLRLLETDAQSGQRKMTYLDQDALNVVCQGKVKFLDMSWNLQTLFCREDMYEKILTDDIRNAFDLAKSNCKIVHFVGFKKPWMYKGVHFADVYDQYAAQTDFKEEMVCVRENEMQRIKYIFPYCSVPYNSNIVIYGAGKNGMELYEALQESKFANVLYLVDKKSDSTEEMIKSISALEADDYDHIIISIENEKIALEVYKELSSIGVDTKKIVWEFERISPWKQK